MWPAVKQAFTQEEFRKYVDAQQWTKWRPDKVVWHNTAAPSLAQWIKSANQDKANGAVPGSTRIKNLEAYFRDNNGWSGCPHLFVANDYIWVMNPLTAPGVHSPSWNGTSFGIEMIGDYSTEDDDSGAGLAVKNNTIFATAVLCNALGIDPSKQIFLHKQDPKTTHDCPGHNIAKDKFDMIASVSALMAGGEHNPSDVSQVIEGEVPGPKPVVHGRTTVGDLNFRTGPGIDNPVVGTLPKGVLLEILDTAKNGTTSWLRVKTPAGYIGWVSGQYVQKETVDVN
jgi:hypothetical protein